MRRLIALTTTTAIALLLLAPAALAHDGGEGLYGQTNDKVTTAAGFILILFFPTFIFFTPALGRELVAKGGQDGAITYGLQLDHGNSEVNKVEQEFAGASPPGNTYGFHAITPVQSKAMPLPG